MKTNIIVMALGLLLGAAVTGFSGSTSIEASKATGASALGAAIPLALKGKAASLRCTTRLRFNRSGYHNRCPYGRLVTGVQVLDNNLAVLTCGELVITCR